MRHMKRDAKTAVSGLLIEANSTSGKWLSRVKRIIHERASGALIGIGHRLSGHAFIRAAILVVQVVRQRLGDNQIVPVDVLPSSASSQRR